MKITKLLVFITLLLFSTLISTSCLCHRTSEVSITKNMDDLPFDKINIGSFFKVRLTQGEDYQVRVKVSEHFVPHLISTIQDGELIVYIDRHDLRMRNLNFKDTAEVSISVPDFKFIELQGAAKLNMDGKWLLNDAAIRISGAAKVECEQVTAQNLSIRQLGASLVEGNLAVEKLNLITAGACKMVLKAIEPHVASELNLQVSGASKIDLQELPVDNVHLDAAGASKIKIYPIKHLDAEVSGTSKVLYDDTSSSLKKDIRKKGSVSVKPL